MLAGRVVSSWRTVTTDTNLSLLLRFGSRQSVQSKTRDSPPIRPLAARPARGESASGWFVLAGLFILCLVPRMIMAWKMPGICPDAVLYISLGKAIEAGRFQEAMGQIRFNIYPVILSCLHHFGLSWETAGVAWGVAIASCTVLPLFGWIGGPSAAEWRSPPASCMRFTRN